MKTIEIIVTPAGDAQLKTQGFTGRSCLEASRFLETALGRNVSDRLTSEFFTIAHDFQGEQLSVRPNGL
jgi:hypothetical protein